MKYTYESFTLLAKLCQGTMVLGKNVRLVHSFGWVEGSNLGLSSFFYSFQKKPHEKKRMSTKGSRNKESRRRERREEKEEPAGVSGMKIVINPSLNTRLRGSTSRPSLVGRRLEDEEGRWFGND